MISTWAATFESKSEREFKNGPIGGGAALLGHGKFAGPVYYGRRRRVGAAGATGRLMAASPGFTPGAHNTLRSLALGLFEKLHRLEPSDALW